MEKSFIGQEDQMSKLRTEVGANLNSLNYDISGLLQFKNESGKRMSHAAWLYVVNLQTQALYFYKNLGQGILAKDEDCPIFA